MRMRLAELAGAPHPPESSRRIDETQERRLRMVGAFVVDPARSVENTVHHYYSQPVRWSVAAGVPVTDALSERDRPVRVMAGPLPGLVEVIRVDSGHLLPVTSPAVFAEVVNRVAA
jgi:hypothetical protein